MAISDNPVPAVPTDSYSRKAVSSARLLETFRAATMGLGAGWRAAADLHRLNRMTDGDLCRLGIARSDISRRIFDRHFADLGKSSSI